MKLTNSQRGVRLRIAIAAILTVTGLYAGIELFPVSISAETGMYDRLTNLLVSELLVIPWLILCIGRLGNHRFFTPEDMDGSGLTPGTEKAKVLQAILQNTLEQTVLAFTVHLTWAVTMPTGWQGALPVAAMLFFTGRLLFIRGYAGGAPSRALGFALTFYPSVIMFLVIILTQLYGFVAG